MQIRAKWVMDRQLRIRAHVPIRIPKSFLYREIKDRDFLFMPGLVNAHVHLDYTQLRGRIPSTTDFASWIHQIRSLKKNWSSKDYIRSIQQGVDDSLKWGTSCLGNWICDPSLIHAIHLHSLQILWLWEQIAFQSNPIPNEKWRDWISQKSKVHRFGLAPHAPYTFCQETLRQTVDFCQKHQVPWSIHVAESKQERQMFRGKGPLFDMMQSAGRSMDDCRKKSPLQMVREVLTKGFGRLILIHANELSEADFRWLGSQSRKAISIAHCPRSHAYFRHSPFPLKRLLKEKINVCLGTDSLASNEDLSMFKEMGSVARAFPDIHPKKWIEMATRSGARALGIANWERQTDGIVIPIKASKASEVWEEIICWDKPILARIKWDVRS